MTIAFEATMYFKYGLNKRPDIKSTTTFEAILNGERTSTTRFDIWKGTEKWASLKPGDIVRFFEDKFKHGRYVDVIIDSISRIDLSTFDDEAMKFWSQAEGWSVSYGRSISSRGSAYWIKYHLLK